MPLVRARKPMYHNGVYRRKGDTFEVTEGQLAEARKRYKERHIEPAFELAKAAKPKPEDDAGSIA